MQPRTLTLMFLTTATMKKFFLNLTLEYSFVPVINKPTQIKKNTSTAIYHIITNSLLHRTINTGILKLDILDQFPIFLIRKSTNHKTFNKQ